MQQTRPEETVLDLHGRECDKNDVLMVSLETGLYNVHAIPMVDALGRGAAPVVAREHSSGKAEEKTRPRD